MDANIQLGTFTLSVKLIYLNVASLAAPEAGVHVWVVVLSTSESKEKQRQAHKTLADSSHTCRWQDLTWIPMTVPEAGRGKCKDPSVTGDPVRPGFSHLSVAQHLGEGGVFVTLSCPCGVAECLLFNDHIWSPHMRVSVVSRLQHLCQVHCHLSPGGGSLLQGVSSVLDLCNAPWLKVAGGGDPGGEGFREQHPLEDVRRQVRQPVRRTVPLCDVLQLLAAAFPHYDTVPEIGLLWVEACESGPRVGGGRLLLLHWMCGRFQLGSGPVWWNPLDVILA